MQALDPDTALVIFVALWLGGMAKGATGAGVPLLAVPVIAAVYDVRLAVAAMVVPNLFSNTWQLVEYRSARLAGGFTWRFAFAGALGALAGTVLLATLPDRALILIVALLVSAYIVLRLAHPDFRLGAAMARRLAIPVGLAAGLMQGAAGISAPVAVSYLNAMRLPRPAFIATISAIFLAMSIVQLPALIAAGFLTPALLGLSILALAPLLLAMRVGAWLARRLTPEGFDRLTLLLLGVLALRLFQSILF